MGGQRDYGFVDALTADRDYRCVNDKFLLPNGLQIRNPDPIPPRQWIRNPVVPPIRKLEDV